MFIPVVVICNSDPGLCAAALCVMYVLLVFSGFCVYCFHFAWSPLVDIAAADCPLALRSASACCVARDRLLLANNMGVECPQ
jgi:hypothetical protein